MSALLALLLLLQPPLPVQAYTTADPVSAERLGLALPDGRYMIEPGRGCEGIAYGMNVTVITMDDASAVLLLSTEPDKLQACGVSVGERMSDVPCFTIDDVCDVRAETDD